MQEQQVLTPNTWNTAVSSVALRLEAICTPFRIIYWSVAIVLQYKEWDSLGQAASESGGAWMTHPTTPEFMFH